MAKTWPCSVSSRELAEQQLRRKRASCSGLYMGCRGRDLRENSNYAEHCTTSHIMVGRACGRSLKPRGSREGGGASSWALVFADKWAQCSALLTSQSKNKSPPKRAIFILFGEGGQPLSPRRTLAADESAWWCWELTPRATMPGLFFVCGTAVNTTWGEEPKTEPHLKWKAPGWRAGRSLPILEGTRGLTKQGHQACPWFSGIYLLRSLQV